MTDRAGSGPISDAEVREIIERVRRRMAEAGDVRPAAAMQAAAQVAAAPELGDGIHPTVDAAVAAAGRAFAAYRSMGLDRRYAIVDAIRRAMLEAGERLALLAHQETHLGRVEDKIVKNRVVTTKAPGP